MDKNRYFVIFAIIFSLSGCQNYAAIKQFSKSGKELSKSLANAQHLDYKSCLAAAQLSELTRVSEGVAKSGSNQLPRYLVSLKTRQSACEPYLVAEKNLLEITSHLELFYTKLEELADSGISTSADSNIDGLMTAVSTIPSVDQAVVKAAGSIGKFTAKLILTKKQDKEMESALSIMPQVNILLEAIKYYYSNMYSGFLRGEKEKVAANFKMLESAERYIHENALRKGNAGSEFLSKNPSNEFPFEIVYRDYAAKTELMSIRQELERYSILENDVQAKIDLGPKITGAISTMQEQNLTIMENYKKLDKEDYFKSLTQLYKSLKEINQSIAAIKESE